MTLPKKVPLPIPGGFRANGVKYERVLEPPSSQQPDDLVNLEGRMADVGLDEREEEEEGYAVITQKELQETPEWTLRADL